MAFCYLNKLNIYWKMGFKKQLNNFCVLFLCIFFFPFEGNANKDCPADIVSKNPSSGDVFLKSAINGLVKIKPNSKVEASLELNMNVYYFATADKDLTTRLFAMVRSYETDRFTSIEGKAVVSNSKYRKKGKPKELEEKIFLKRDYSRDHSHKNYGDFSFLDRFHLAFKKKTGFINRLSALIRNTPNSYNVMETPIHYLPPKIINNKGEQIEANAVKATMQRYERGIDPKGRCIRFNLFNRQDFVDSVQRFSAIILSISEELDEPVDRVEFNILAKNR